MKSLIYWIVFCISNQFMKRLLGNQVMKINVLAPPAFPLLTSFCNPIAKLQNGKIAKLQFYLHLKSIFALLPPRRANSTQFSFGRQIVPVWSNQVVTFSPSNSYNKRKEPIYKLSIWQMWTGISIEQYFYGRYCAK